MEPESTELIKAPTQLVSYKPTELPKLPPTPVFDEHIEAYLAQIAAIPECKNIEDHERLKALGNTGTRLKKQIADSYAELKRAIDDIKQPVLDNEKRDTAKVEQAIKSTDAIALPWQREQDRIAQEEANRKAQEEVERKQRENEKEAEFLKEWGDDEGAKKVEAQVVPPARPVTASAGLTWRKGARVNPTWKAVIESPDKVKRVYCAPDPAAIKAKIQSFVKLTKGLTNAQIKAKLEAEIGGVTMVFE